ncbi:MAG: hypothetical protein JEY99_05420 [Spirochaetales bacterium]|nr:hypothetical protein [Spirochaetales bacterium]
MTCKERFYCAVNRESVDRPAIWTGLPVPDSLPGLFEYFKVSNETEYRLKVNDDIFPVELPYHSPAGNAIYTALNFAKGNDGLDDFHRTLTAPGFFEGFTDPAKVDDFEWPDPSRYIDPAECMAVVNAVPDDKAVLAAVWSAHFQDACAAFGMENAMITMMMDPEMFDVVINRITDFYLKANEIFYKSVGGKVDVVLIGNDFGSQQSLMLSPEMLRAHVFNGTKKLVDQAHSFGYKVMHHSCGSIYQIIPDLIEMGVDIIHPLQALADGMGAEDINEKFGGQVSFCGALDAQNLLVNGTAEDVINRVKELKTLFPTGLIISPSHEAVLPDIDPANIEAIHSGLL